MKTLATLCMLGLLATTLAVAAPASAYTCATNTTGVYVDACVADAPAPSHATARAPGVNVDAEADPFGSDYDWGYACVNERCVVVIR